MDSAVSREVAGSDADVCGAQLRCSGAAAARSDAGAGERRAERDAAGDSAGASGWAGARCREFATAAGCADAWGEDGAVCAAGGDGVPAADRVPEHRESAGGAGGCARQRGSDSHGAGGKPDAAAAGAGGRKHAAVVRGRAAGTAGGGRDCALADQHAGRDTARGCDPHGLGGDCVCAGGDFGVRIACGIDSRADVARHAGADRATGVGALAQRRARAGTAAPDIAGAGGGTDGGAADWGGPVAAELLATALGEPGLRDKQRADDGAPPAEEPVSDRCEPHCVF